MGTSGPLVSYLLLLPRLVGCPFGYAAARVVGLLTIVGAIFFLYLAVRQIARRPLARLAIVPTTVFFALTVRSDFVHYSGELCPLLLLSVALFCLAKLWRSSTRDPGLMLIIGLIAGAVPFAKLQAALLALLIGLTAMIIVARRSSNTAESLRNCALMVLGGLTPLIAVLVLTWSTGCFEVFKRSYLLANLNYAGQGRSFAQSVSSFPEFFSQGELLTVCLKCEGLLGILALITGAIITRRKSRQTKIAWLTRQEKQLLAFMLVVSGVTVYSVLAPGRHFPHYLQFLLIPGVLWFANCLVYLDRGLGILNLRRPHLATSSLVVLATTLIAISSGIAAGRIPRPIGHMQAFLGSPIPPPVIAVKKIALPGQPIAIWGWMGEMFVDTGMWKATRDTVLEYSVLSENQPAKPTTVDYKEIVPQFFQDLFLEDLQKSNPPIFVDAVCPGCIAFHDRKRYGYETFPQLADYVDAHYRVVEEVCGVRIFLRKKDTPENLK
ncbi:MAG: hypothetical protein M3128_02860 [Verrucomicrobiota bacterium]|nr:hypothetical protein [Verrucomicrobiota bacterium]